MGLHTGGILPRQKGTRFRRRNGFLYDSSVWFRLYTSTCLILALAKSITATTITINATTVPAL